jgi:hypothetical protein
MALNPLSFAPCQCRLFLHRDHVTMLPSGMVHTRYHLKVHGSALPGALQRLGAALSQPLLAADSAGREVENVHAEYRWGC